MAINACGGALATLSGLTNDCQPNMGGVRNIWLCNFKDVASIVDKDGKDSDGTTILKDAAEPTMADGKKFLKYDIRKNTSSATQTVEINEEAGTFAVNTELNIVFNRMDDLKRLEANAISMNEMRAIYQDQNGYYWLIGHDNPVTISAATGETGTQATDANRYSLTVKDTASVFNHPVDAAVVAGIVDRLV